MGPLLAHFIVKSKGFIDHFILFFLFSPVPYPLSISAFIILISVHLFKFQLFFQVSTLLITLVHHLFVTGELDAALIFFLLFFVINLFPTLKYFYHFYCEHYVIWAEYFNLIIGLIHLMSYFT